MPWSKKQVRVAEAVKHGWKAKGKAKGFTKAFASQVISEGEKATSLGSMSGWSSMLKRRKKPKS